MSESLLDPRILRQLLRDLEGTDIDELELASGTRSVFLRREPSRPPPPGLAAPSDQQLDSGVPLVAPLTGVFYGRPSPEQAPYVSPGTTVASGQVVALIETMKLFNEVIAEVTGDVTAIRANDGDLVEAGQPLMYIQPREEETTS